MYLIREHVRVAYGLIEMSGATVLAWITLAEHYTSGVVFATALMGAIYIFVRRIDNFCQFYRDEGWSERTLSSAVSHFDALDKGIAELLREEDVHNAVTSTEYQSKIQSFVVLAQEVLVDFADATRHREAPNITKTDRR